MIYETEKELRLGGRISEATLDVSGTFADEAIRLLSRLPRYMGDREVRRLLYVAASRILRRDAALWCPLKVWAVRPAQRVGIRRARVALARKLLVVLHAMWSERQVFQWPRTEASASA